MKKYFRRILSWLLTFALLLQLAPSMVFAADDNSASSAPAVAGNDPDASTETTYDDDASPPDAQVVGEVTEYRNESEKHFRMDDGSFIAVDYGVPVHYALDDETWQDIDNTLVLQDTNHSEIATYSVNSTDDVPTYTAENGEDNKSFAANLSTGFLFSSQRGNTGVRLCLPESEALPADESSAEDEKPEETAADTPQEDEGSDSGETDTASSAEPTNNSDQDAEEEQPAAQAASSESATVSKDDHADPAAPASTDQDTSEPDSAPEQEPAPQVSDNSQDSEADPLPTPSPSAPQAVDDDAEEQVQFNRNAEAQISYPDQEGIALFSAQNTDTSDRAFSEKITPPHLYTQVSYADVYPGVDLQYELYSYDIKESIFVKEPLDDYTFSFQMDLAGLTPTLQEDGSIQLTDAEDNLVYSIPAPYMTDASNAYSEAVSYELAQQEDGTWLLTVAADKEWIDASDREFPICIDPTLVDETKSKDFVGTVCNETNSQISTSAKLACGYHKDHRQMEIYYKLNDLPTIPAGHTLVRARVGFYQNDYRSYVDSLEGSMVLYMSEITQDATLDSSLTWANRPSHGPILDYVNSSYETVNSILLWDVTQAAKKWYDGGKNYGLAMTSNGNSTTKNRTWFSYANRVYFVVSYRNTNGIEDYYTYQTLGVGNAGTAYIGDFSGQLTVCKKLVSYASTVNPVSIDMIYNSSYALQYGEEPYDAGYWLGLGMHVPGGTKLNIMQKVESVTLQNDANADNKSTYMKYTDGDGTIHYFSKDPSKSTKYYYDEDGLGLKINEYRTGCYMISDDKDNELYFVNGYLVLINDANGNEIQVHYTHKDGTSAENGYPNSSGDRINKVVQKNTGCDAITVATFTYNSNNTLTGITDAAGNKYTFSCTSGRLSKILRNGTAIAQYGTSSTQIPYIYDVEAKYGVAFDYTAKKVSSYYEITSPSTSSKPGAIVSVGHLENGQTFYRDYGSNRIEDDDDILTYYTFDYAGRSANVYTTDTSNRIRGASNAVYSGVGSTDRTNNRTLRTASIGVSAMNDLRNHGFELSSPAWELAKGGGASAEIQSSTVRTGSKAFHTKAESGTNGTASAKQATNTLIPGVSYTLSAYVNTSKATAFQGRGVYLLVMDGDKTVATSDYLNYATDTAIDQGWVRLSLPFTVSEKKTYKVCVYSHCVGGDVYVDDFQLECSDTPSTLNLLENGNLQYWGHGWTMGSNAKYQDDCGLFSESHYAYSIRTTGDAYTESCAYQDVPVGKAGASFVMSGWAKANAIPDNKQTETGDDAAAKDKHKQFGLRAILTYSDGSTEYHYVPFNPDITDWQYTSTAIVPKKDSVVVSSIRVVCAYERNCNYAWFDNLSLVEEAAQTMKYDKDGNLVSVKSSGSSEEQRAFSSGNLTSLKTGASGTFTYTYDSKHNVTSASNGIVVENTTYDSSGNVLSATVAPKSGGDKIVTTNTYSNSNNLLASVTQRGNLATTYTYADAQNKMLGLPSSVVDPLGVTVSTSYDSTGRPTTSTVSKSGSNLGSVSYQYSKSLLQTVSRTAGSTVQSYRFVYDSFGNTTSLSVGNRKLAEYTYGSKNGMLEKQTYGNGDTVSMQYDDLNRTTSKTVTSSNGSSTYYYSYTGDGQLYKMEDSAAGVTYQYNYDSLGRLINSSQTGGNANLRSSFVYDTENRLKKINYSIPGIIDSATESFYYNTNTSDAISDGSLTSMTMFNGSWIYYRYDSLSRLKERDLGNVLTEHQTYLAGSGDCTTTTLPETYYTSAKGSTTKLSGFQYAYDNIGNITKITNQVDKTYWNYAYDGLGQLRYATDYQTNGTANNRYKYYYDNAGNLTSWKIQDDSGTSTKVSHTYTYGDSDWKDLLTAFDGQSITYDAIGNPLSYYNGSRYTMTWQNGRQLASAAVGGKTYTYQYDSNGIRTRKTNYDGGYTEYYVVNGLPVAEQRFRANGTKQYILRYLFDEGNSPVGFGIYYPTAASPYWQYYYFGKNLQGDVIALYRSDYNSTSKSYTPTLVATYTYDPWGAPTGIYSASGTAISQTASNVAAYNPFRYRGYRYDGDTRLYYLQSRYYDPAIGRFINADVYASTGQGLIGHNLFAYCLNAPIASSDPDGTLTRGQIHNYVVGKFVSQRENLMSSKTMIYYNKKDARGGIGFCDIYDSKTGEVWEVKRDSNSRSCRTKYAKAQLDRYVHGRLKENLGLELKVGYTEFESGSFTITDWTGRYDITYWDEGDGILRYDYVYTKSKEFEYAEAALTVAAIGIITYATCGAGATVAGPALGGALGALVG